MKTLAVVIGNNNYHESARLQYAVNDALALAGVFSRLGYDVVQKSDITASQCSDILLELKTKITDYDATIFYFAGHGFELEGENYLTSINCQIPPGDEYNASRNSITLTELLKIYKGHPNKINILIIDACRKAFNRGGASTFAPVQAPQGTLIAYSTSPEDGAQDGGYDENSVYTGTLLKYIGREMLSVEELFKKVRKTVHSITKGKQTPWEHTSLIGDFYFNTGQLVHSVNIPYSEQVVKDASFQGSADQFSYLINEARVSDWNRQNPAFFSLLSIDPKTLDKNQQFLLGRNLLQAGNVVYNASDFFDNLQTNLTKYTINGENHVLNGILFEIYFNNHGEFRKERFKLHRFDELMAIRKYPAFSKSFTFISSLLQQYRAVRPFWLPSLNDDIIDVDLTVTTHEGDDGWGNNKQYSIIEAITVYSNNIIDQIRHYGIIGLNELALKKAVANYLGAPETLIDINSAKPINNIVFPTIKEEETPFADF